MKTKLLLILAVLAMNAAIAQTTPTLVIITFERDYPNTTPVWTSIDCYHRGEYLDKINNTWRAVVYDQAGYVLHRDWKMDNNYPTRIKDYFKAVYPGEAYSVWSSIDDSGCQNYYVIRATEKIWFDKNGKMKKYSIC